MYDSYQALIFDMDGTLVDSGQLHQHTWSLTLEKYGIPVDRALMRSLAGVPIKATLEILLEKFQIRPRANLDEMNAFKENCTREHMRGFVKATELLEVVKKYQGIKPMAIGTGSKTAEARMVLALCGLDDKFKVVVGADQVKNPKPAPDTFLRCAELLGVEPGHCVVFEDSPLGLQAAQRAGMMGIDVFQVHKIKNDYFC